MRLTGKVALVTGGARGIGRAIAGAFRNEGASVAIADIDRSGAEAAAEELGAGALGLAANVADPAEASRIVAETVARFGRLDILVNNAGIGGNTPFLETTLAEWQQIQAVNLTGAFLVAQAAAREMVRAGSGRIVNITSLSGQRGGEGRAAYGSAKAGLELLTKVIAVELAPHNVTANAIAPGPVDTELAKQVHGEAVRQAYLRLVPLRRYGLPEEIAAAAVFLASDESAYVTGHVLNVDGGFLMAGLMSR